MRARSVICSPILITLTLAIATYVIIPTFIRARAEARFSQFQNLSFNHSGSHVCDVVYLGRDFEVIGVSSCPLCSHPDAELAFVIWEPGQPIVEVEKAELSPATVEQAERQLYSYKATPRYHALRKAFSTPRDIEFRDWLFAYEQARPAEYTAASSSSPKSSDPDRP